MTQAHFTRATGGSIQEPPEQRYGRNGVTLTLKHVASRTLATVVMCAETQAHAIMWTAALKGLQVESLVVP